jgi:hypothetical protein
MRWSFKADTTHEFWIGLGYAPNATLTTPYRFVGVHAIPGTANFQFDALNGGTLQRGASAVPVDSAWHTLELRWNTVSGKWAMSLDGGAEVEVTDTLTTDLRWTPYAWVESKAASLSTLLARRFIMFGTY